jgi:CBS domain-containing protein
MARSLKINQVLPSLNMLRPVKFGSQLRNRFCVDSTAPVGQAAQKMAQERLTFVMVCDPAADKAAPPHVVGMMTERDFLRYMTYATDSTFFSGQHPLDKKVSQVMTPLGRMTQLHPNTPVNAALRSIQHRIWRHLPVVDGPPGKEVLCSIVSIRDLILVRCREGGRAQRKDVSGCLGKGHGKEVLCSIVSIRDLILVRCLCFLARGVRSALDGRASGKPRVLLLCLGIRLQQWVQKQVHPRSRGR